MRQPASRFVLKSGFLIGLLAVSFTATYAADKTQQSRQLTSADVEFWVGSSSYLHPFTAPSSRF